MNDDRENLIGEAGAPPYVVLVNDELQYSIWPAARAVPAGWREVAVGNHEQCLEYVQQNWFDMRPLRVRGTI